MQGVDFPATANHPGVASGQKVGQETVMSVTDGRGGQHGNVAPYHFMMGIAQHAERIGVDAQHLACAVDADDARGATIEQCLVAQIRLGEVVAHLMLTQQLIDLACQLFE